jgi:hypothetical protein
MSAAEEFTPEERDALLRALVKVVGPEKLAKLARSELPMVREPDPDRRAKIREKVVKHMKRQGAL